LRTSESKIASLVFSRDHTAVRPEMTLYTRGFSHFVTSMTAPIASGWSKIAGWGSHPLRNAALTRRTPQFAVPQNILTGNYAANSGHRYPAIVIRLSASRYQRFMPSNLIDWFMVQP
jgi:hypothetical protein